MSTNMNRTLEVQVNIGIGPQLVVIGTILGSILVAALTLSITEEISWSEISYIAISMQDAETNDNNGLNSSDQSMSVESNPVESISNEQIIGETNECQVSNKFPDSILQWCQEISTYSINYNLSPNLIAAVILQESGGDPLAFSHSGAVGLMQVMPRDGIAATFMCINGPCFTNRPTIKELQDPTFNIDYGTRMVANLQAKYGDIRDALRFYGPMDVGYSYADKVLAIFERYQ